MRCLNLIREKHNIKDSLNLLEVELSYNILQQSIGVQGAGKLYELVRWSFFQEVTWKVLAI